MLFAVLFIAKVGVPVAPAQVMLLPSRGMLAVTVWLAVNAALMVTSSCGKGTLPDQALSDQFPPDVPDQVCGAAVVITKLPVPRVLVFPPASPIELAPPLVRSVSPTLLSAKVMSIKSTLVVPVRFAPVTVMVRAVPRVSDLTKGRLTDDWPAKDSVPVTVKLAYITKPSVFDAVPVRVRVPKVAAEAYSRGSLAPVKLTI